MRSAPQVNIVILAAGKGERFAIEGIDVPKPLIEFRGRSLLQRTVDIFPDLTVPYRLTVVGTTAVATVAERMAGVDRVVPVTVIQPGPIASALLSLAHLEPELPVVFTDCDNIYTLPRNWLSAMPIGENFVTGAALPDNLSYSDFSNILVGDKGNVKSICEKPSRPPDVPAYATLVGTGIYGFTAASIFRHCAYRALTSVSYATKEAPMSAVSSLTHYLKAVTVENWLPAGTPAQMTQAARHATPF